MSHKDLKVFRKTKKSLFDRLMEVPIAKIDYISFRAAVRHKKQSMFSTMESRICVHEFNSYSNYKKAYTQYQLYGATRHFFFNASRVVDISNLKVVKDRYSLEQNYNIPVEGAYDLFCRCEEYVNLEREDFPHDIK